MPNTALDIYAHPDAGRYDKPHGDECTRESLKFKNLSLPERQRFYDLLDILIADRINDDGMQKVTELLVCDMGDEFRELLTTATVPDVDAADVRTVRHMAKVLNSALLSLETCFREEYEEQILYQIQDERERC